jgi:hypothetical protein
VCRRVFKTRSFARWSRKAPVPDSLSCLAIEEMAHGLIDADLGGGVYKKRVQMPGGGKRGGARVIIGTNRGSRWFLIFGYLKSERPTVAPQELVALQRLTEVLLAMETTALERAIETGELQEICHHEEKPTTR